MPQNAPDSVCCVLAFGNDGGPPPESPPAPPRPVPPLGASATAVTTYALALGCSAAGPPLPSSSRLRPPPGSCAGDAPGGNADPAPGDPLARKPFNHVGNQQVR